MFLPVALGLNKNSTVRGFELHGKGEPGGPSVVVDRGFSRAAGEAVGPLYPEVTSPPLVSFPPNLDFPESVDGNASTRAP
jgi:hypothetical protein